MALADIKGKYYFELNITETVWKSMSIDSQKSVMESVLKKVLDLEKNNAQFWIDFGVLQGSKIVSFNFRGSGLFGMSVFDVVDSTGKVYTDFFLFGSSSNTAGYKSFGPCYCQTGFTSHWTGSISYSFTTPVLSVVIPEPVINVPITKYIQFMEKTSLYNSYVKNVNVELVKKQSVQVITDFIFGIFKNLTDGMVIYDYYQWQGETGNGNYDLRMYKQFYLRVFGKVGNDLVSKSIPIDYHLFAGIAGATLLDNGIMIAGNALTDKAGTYIRYGYIIHANNCDLQALIDKIQADSVFSLTPISFPAYEDIKEQLAEGKAFLGKDGKTIQERFNDSLAGYRSFYRGMKSLLGLTDEQVEFFSQRDSQRDIQKLIDSQSLSLSAETSVQNAEVQKQQYQQAQAEQTEKQFEKEQAKEEKAKQQALQVEKNKQSNSSIVKKVYASYLSAMNQKKALDKKLGNSNNDTILSYSEFETGCFSNLKSTYKSDGTASTTFTCSPPVKDVSGKYIKGYSSHFSYVIRDTDKDGVIDSYSIKPFTVLLSYADTAEGENQGAVNLDTSPLLNLSFDKPLLPDNSKVLPSNTSASDVSQEENSDSLSTISDVATSILALTSRFNAFTAAFSASSTSLGATEEKNLAEFYKQNSLMSEQLAEMKGRNTNDKLIPQYLEKLSNKNMSPDVAVNLDTGDMVTALNSIVEEQKNHFAGYKERENKRVEREEIAHTDWHGKETEESITLGGVRKNGAPVVLDMPQGYFGRLKKSGFYQKQAEELYDVESDNQAGNGMSKVKGSGQSSFKIDTTKEIKHITGEDYEIAKEFGEFDNISKVAEGYQATVQKWIDDSWVDGEYSPE